jgi:hypothetical protein
MLARCVRLYTPRGIVLSRPSSYTATEYIRKYFVSGGEGDVFTRVTHSLQNRYNTVGRKQKIHTAHDVKYVPRRWDRNRCFFSLRAPSLLLSLCTCTCVCECISLSFSLCFSFISRSPWMAPVPRRCADKYFRNFATVPHRVLHTAVSKKKKKNPNDILLFLTITTIVYVHYVLLFRDNV